MPVYTSFGALRDKPECFYLLMLAAVDIQEALSVFGCQLGSTLQSNAPDSAATERLSRDDKPEKVPTHGTFLLPSKCNV